MQLQSCARILFGELGAWHCCANKSAVVSHFEIENRLLTILFCIFIYFFYKNKKLFKNLNSLKLC